LLSNDLLIWIFFRRCIRETGRWRRTGMV